MQEFGTTGSPPMPPTGCNFGCDFACCTKASTQLMFSRLLEPAKSPGDWYEKKDDAPDSKSDLIRPDGSRVYNKLFAEMPTTEVTQKAKNYSRVPVYSLDVKLVGSYDPSDTGCMREDFFDGMHPKDSCIEKIFASVQR